MCVCVLQGFVGLLLRLISQEASRLESLEGTAGDTSEGFAINFLTDTFRTFLEVDAIFERVRDSWNGSSFMPHLLGSYLTLRFFVPLQSCFFWVFGPLWLC